MIRNELVGVAILTYNRPESFAQLCKSVLDCKDIDYVVVVKDKDIDYGQNSPSKESSDRYVFVQSEDGSNIAHCKNLGLSTLLDKGCKHLFMIEDDVVVKDSCVFEKYISTAKAFNLGHLNWNTIPEVTNNPIYKVALQSNVLTISFRVCGAFSYFSREALVHCGLLDEVNFVNALEHAEHAYRIAAQRYTTPFYAFADIDNANDFLQNIGEGQSTIEHESEQYRKNLSSAYHNFSRIYGKAVSGIPVPSRQQAVDFLMYKLKLIAF